jgi:hypothetical protein
MRGRPKGSGNRLTEAKVNALVQRWRDGESSVSIASSLGVSNGAVTSVLNGNSWGWLTGIEAGTSTKNQGHRS